MRLKKGFVLREVCGEKVIVGEGLGALDFGRLLSLNESAAWLWEEAVRQGDFTAETLAGALYETYDVDEAEALKDVEHILEQWRSVNVLE